MFTLRNILLLTIIFCSISSFAQGNRDWVKLDYTVIDSLAALDKNNPAEVYRFFSGSRRRDIIDMGFGWTFIQGQIGGGYGSFVARFYLYKDTVKAYVIKAWLPNDKELTKEYQALFSRVLTVHDDGYYALRYGKDNVLRPLDAYDQVGKRDSISNKLLQYMSPESGLEYGYRGGMAGALLKNRSAFLDLENNFTAGQVVAMMYSINPASRLTAIEYYLKNKHRFKITNETLDWIERVYQEVPEVYTMNGCLYGKENSKKLVAYMVKRKKD